MIAELNRLVEYVDRHLTDEIDVPMLAMRLGMTDYHLRRMFSSLAGMPLSEYIRRRRMTVAAADVLGESELLGIAVRYGYGSTEGGCQMVCVSGEVHLEGEHHGDHGYQSGARGASPSSEGAR